MSFLEMNKVMVASWKSVDEDTRSVFEELAEVCMMLCDVCAYYMLSLIAMDLTDISISSCIIDWPTHVSQACRRIRGGVLHPHILYDSGC